MDRDQRGIFTTYIPHFSFWHFAILRSFIKKISLTFLSLLVWHFWSVENDSDINQG